MFFLITSAFADSTSQSQGPSMNFLLIIFFIAMMYFLFIRPQQKRAKQHQALINSLKKGDKVVTNSGIVGTVAKLSGDQEIVLEISDGVFVKFVKSTVAHVVNPKAPVAENSAKEDKPKKSEDTKEEK